MSTVEELLLNINTEGGAQASNQVRSLEAVIRSLISPIETLSASLRENTLNFERLINGMRQGNNEFDQFRNDTTQTDRSLNDLQQELSQTRIRFNELQNEQRQDDQEMDQLRASIVRLEQQLREQESQVRQNINIFNNFNNELTQTDNRMDRVHASGSRMSGIMQTIAGSFAGMLIANVVTDALYRLADAFKTAITGGISYNATMEDLTTAFKVMLGSADKASTMVANLKKMGAETPFETVQLAEYTKMLLSFGYTEQNVIPIMSRLGDVSMGNSEKMSSLTRTMGQINSLGKLQGGDLNQLIAQGWRPLNQIMERTGETNEQVMARMSAGKISYKEVEQALIDITSAGGQFYNGMVEGSKTFSGKMSTLKDQFNDFMGSAMKPVFDYMRDTGIPAMSALIPKFQNLVDIIKKNVSPTLAELKGIWKAIMPDIDWGGVVDNFATKIPGALKTTADAAKDVKEKIQWVRDVLDALKSGSIVNLVDLFPKSMQDSVLNVLVLFDKFKAILSDVGNFIVTVFTPVINQFKETFKNMDTSVILAAWDNLKNSFVNILPALKLVGGFLITGLAVAIGVVMSVLNAMFAVLPNIIAILLGIQAAIENFWTLVTGIFTGNGELIKNGWLGMWNSIWSIISNVGSAIWKYVSTFITTIISFFQGLYDAVVGKSIIPDMVNGIISWFSNLWNSVVALVMNLVNAVVNLFQNLWNSAINIFNGVVNSIRSILSTLWSVVSSAVQNAVQAVSNKASAMWDAAKNVANKIIDAIADVGKSLYKSGQNAIQNFIDGIGSMVSKVGTAAKGIANKVADFLGFSSPTKEGPGKEADKWAGNLINMFTDQLSGGISKMRNATENLANTMNPTQYLQATQYPNVNTSNSNQNISIVVNGANMDINQIGNDLVKQLRIKGVLK